MDGTVDQTAALAGDMGGSGAPVNEAPQSGGNESGSSSAPAWTNQLSRELRDNADVFGKVANFKTISDLVSAYAKAEISDEELLQRFGVPKPDEPYGIEDKLGDDMKDFLKMAREINLSKGQAQKVFEAYQGMLNNATTNRVENLEKVVAENAKSLVDEFGAEARNWWNKAASSEKDLKVALAKSGLSGSKALMRAMVLLGRETSEESTQDGTSHGRAQAKTWAEGGKLNFSYV